MLVDYTYFLKGLCRIAGITSGTTPVDEANNEELNALIEVYEPEIMDRVFGIDFYNALIAGLAVTPTPEARWTALKNALVNSTAKTSPIANYVAFKNMQLNQQVSTRSGDKAIIPAGMVVEANLVKLIELNNRMVDKFSEFSEWLTDNATTYPEWDGICKTWTVNDYLNPIL